VPSYAGPAAARPGEIVGTLRLLAYLAAAFALILLDHRGGWLSQVRQQAQAFVQPVWAVAGWPGAVIDSISDDAHNKVEERYPSLNKEGVHKVAILDVDGTIMDPDTLRTQSEEAKAADAAATPAAAPVAK